MASAEEIRKIIHDGNVQLRADITKDIMGKAQEAISVVVDKKLAAHEEKMFAEIRALRDRTAALESRPRAKVSNPDVVGGGAWKRARSEPTAGRDNQEQPCAVITGFPAGTRRKDIEEFANEKLKMMEHWSHLKAFAPNVRGTVAMVRMDDKDCLALLDAPVGGNERLELVKECYTHQ